MFWQNNLGTKGLKANIHKATCQVTSCATKIAQLVGIVTMTQALRYDPCTFGLEQVVQNQPKVEIGHLSRLCPLKILTLLHENEK